jgi:hypothetical protein
MQQTGAMVQDAPFHSCYDDAALPPWPRTKGLSERDWHAGRNRVLGALRPLGSVGPMRDYPLHLNRQLLQGEWGVENDNPTYFVVDDETIDCQYVHIEVDSSESITIDTMSVLWNLVLTTPGFCCGVAVPNARYFYIDASGVWFLDHQSTKVTSLLEALALPKVSAQSAA